MRIAPVTCFHKIPPDKLPLYECSDCIFLPKAFSESLLFKRLDLICIRNGAGQTLTGVLFDTQEDQENVIYVPSWMFLSLEEVDGVSVCHAPKRRCTSIQIRPHSHDLAVRSDFTDLLNSAIIRYHSLTQGTKIPLFINDAVEFVTIQRLLPSNYKTYYIYNSGTVDLSLLPVAAPVTSKEPKAPIPFLYSSPRVEEIYPYAFMGRGFPIGGASDAVESMNPGQAAAAAARKRLAKK